MAGGEAAVRAAFATQAVWCAKLGSPFTALLCDVLGRHLDRGSAVGRRVLDWPGEPDAGHDSVPLRLAGGLHALVRRGRLPDLAALYPPHALPSADALRTGVLGAVRDGGDDLLSWLDSPPQTNEVARSAVLMAGYLAIAHRTGLPLCLLELGASAGLNLIADRYSYRLGTLDTGAAGSALHLAPAWEGPDPPDARVTVAARAGIDRNPLDVRDPADRERLFAYVWPDQADRLARLEAAVAIADADPPPVERGDAADWLEARLAEDPSPGATRVVAHSIAFQYFPADVQGRIAGAMERTGHGAAGDAPLAWLRYETDPAFDGRASLRLRLWPDGTDTVLAIADPHGRRVAWCG